MDTIVKFLLDILSCTMDIFENQIATTGPISVNSVMRIILGAVLYFLWYNLFWKPFNWNRDLTELGYDDVKSSRTQSKDSKRELINELRQKRKIGNLPPVYPNGWFVILESDELPLKGVKEVYVFGQNLVAWRGNTGISYVADAYCPHLGAHLGGGKVSGECIECPFHGWAFHGSDGVLTKIPYSDSVVQSAKLKVWKSLEMNGFIYLWYHAEKEEPSWFPELIPEIQSGEWSYRGRSEFKVGCHVQEIPENGADIAHLNIVHDKAVMCGGEPDKSIFQWNFVKHVWAGSWRNSNEPGEKHIAKLNVNHQMCLFNKIPILQMNVEVRQVGPGTVSLIFETALGRGILFHTVTPIEPLVQKVLHRFYSAKSFIHPYGKLILLGEAIMIERDIRIWNRKTYVSKPLLTKEDKNIKAFRRWYSQFYSENSPRHYFAKNHENVSDLAL